MNTISQIEIKDGWRSLFDGKTLQGWHRFNGTDAGEGWQVSDGCLHFDGRPKKDATKKTCNDLVTADVFSDFHLKIEWKISKNGNSGIMFHVQEHPGYNTPWVTGPEMQVLDNQGHHDGLLEKHRAGDLYDLIASTEDVVKPVGEWNHAEIIVQNKRLSFILNDERTIDTMLGDDGWNKLVAQSKFKDMPDFARAGSGKIALQDHGDPVWFRNIKIKEL